MGNPISEAKDQVVSKVESTTQTFASDVQAKAKAEVSGVVARVTAALANHPKTFVVIALIVGFVLGAVVSAQFASPKSAAGATAPHESYSAVQSGWHEFEPFQDGGARGNG